MKQLLEYLGLLVFAVVALMGVLVTAPLDLTTWEIVFLLIGGVLISIVFLMLYDVKADEVDADDVATSGRSRR